MGLADVQPDNASRGPGEGLFSSLGVARRAATVALAERPARETGAALARLHERPTDEIVHKLVVDQVDQLFLHAVRARALTEQVPASLVESLAALTLRSAAGLIRQDHALREACAWLDENGLPHVVLKGALARAFLYGEPQHRPSVDLDLLIPADQAGRGIRLLAERGYQTSLAAHSDTHEVLLSKPGVQLDLHWNLMRPGRMRHDIAGAMLASRVRYGELWGPGPDYLTVAMLVHPAITDHVTARLISAVDLDRWLRSRPIPWTEVVAILDRIGLRTAAWAMLSWTHSLLGTPVPATVWEGLAVSPLRQRYLASWLARDPAKLFARHPALVRGAFSLALQDRATDALRAVWRLARKERLSLAQV